MKFITCVDLDSCCGAGSALDGASSARRGLEFSSTLLRGAYTIGISGGACPPSMAIEDAVRLIEPSFEAQSPKETL
jgi:hypothetical protein